MSCDRFLGRTHAPRTSRFRCARTRVRTSNLMWSHFAPAPALLIKKVFQQFFNYFSSFSQTGFRTSFSDLEFFSAIFQHFYSLGCSKTEYDDPKQERVFQSRKECSKTGNFVPKSVQKCNRTSHAQKRAARTHIPHTFQNGFRTHTHTYDRTSHVCVRARTFATHTLQINQRLIYRKVESSS